jgi:hypothetical protein
VDPLGWAERVTVAEAMIVNNTATIPSRSVGLIFSPLIAARRLLLTFVVRFLVSCRPANACAQPRRFITALAAVGSSAC